MHESMQDSMQDSMRELMQESGCDTATEPDLEQTCADQEINDPNAETYPKSVLVSSIFLNLTSDTIK